MNEVPIGEYRFSKDSDLSSYLRLVERLRDAGRNPVQITQWISDHIYDLRVRLVVANRSECLAGLISMGHVTTAEILREAILQAKLEVFKAFLPFDASLEELKSLRSEADKKRPSCGENIYDFLNKMIKEFEADIPASPQWQGSVEKPKSELPEIHHLGTVEPVETQKDLPPPELGI